MGKGVLIIFSLSCYTSFVRPKPRHAKNRGHIGGEPETGRMIQEEA